MVNTDWTNISRYCLRCVTTQLKTFSLPWSLVSVILVSFTLFGALVENQTQTYTPLSDTRVMCINSTSKINIHRLLLRYIFLRIKSSFTIIPKPNHRYD